ncbi:hypothetical protein F2P56_016238 [Juglans regia]|uniref:GDSL esterase/lipase 1-like n=1 Tax=Juglans regia TaxID=51240 RepID=A0A833XHV4_JUGRE|nr:hypothetical protein F2P56_016238 [Juglans regia]
MNMMMSSRIRICFLVFMCASLSIIPTPSLGHSHICLPNDHVAQFIFGDSLFDAGNNNYINTTYQYRANVYPYGETFFNYPTGRFSDGRIIPDFIAEFAKLPLIPAYLHPGYKRYADGANFASAGAGALVGTHLGSGIHKEGGRKFAFVNLAPLGCLPLLKVINAGECVDKITALVKLHNKALPHVLQELESQLKGFKYSITDFYSIVSEIMNNPIKYGFKEGQAACCGSGPYRGVNSCGGKRSVKVYELCEKASDYVFFDTGHPTERANLLIAKSMWSGNLSVTWPYNVKALVEQRVFEVELKIMETMQGLMQSTCDEFSKSPTFKMELEG